MCGGGAEKYAVVSTESVAGGRIVAAAAIADVQPLPLRVIEHVEGFGAELYGSSFAVERKMLEQAHVKLGARGIRQGVPPAIAKCQSGRFGKSRRVIQQRTGAHSLSVWNTGTWGAH